jgi:hypothetical protein
MLTIEWDEVLAKHRYGQTQLGSVERVGHDEEQVDVLRLRLPGDERTEDHESRQGASRPSDPSVALRRRDYSTPACSRKMRRTSSMVSGRPCVE